jgi:hypothetical protein
MGLTLRAKSASASGSGVRAWRAEQHSQKAWRQRAKGAYVF